MILGRYRLIRPVLFRAEPEVAHDLAISALKIGIYPRAVRPAAPLLAQNLFGHLFPTPIGMAAGFDKNAEVADALIKLGFGFVEIGTVTPEPQLGNPRPRMFRLKADEAVINRLGFNSEGHARVLSRLSSRTDTGVIGVNIGANKDSADWVEDYVKGVKIFSGLADYLTVNISSPNTPGLRNLQTDRLLGELLDRVMAALGDEGSCPVLVKIAPDLRDDELAAIVEVAISKHVHGLIISNTTISRDGLIDQKFARQEGGLSGPPLFALSTRVLAQAYLMARGKLVLIGAGGVSSARDALTKIEAGAQLVQLYTAMVYQGPSIASKISADLAALLKENGYGSVSEAVGASAKQLAILKM